jgi:hypothetical protein
MWSYFIIVPLEERAIRYYNTFRDPEMLLTTIRDSLNTFNRDVTIVLGDGPMPRAGRAIPIKIDCKTPMDADGRDRHSLIAEGVLTVSDWLQRFREIGEFPHVLDLCLSEP